MILAALKSELCSEATGTNLKYKILGMANRQIFGPDSDSYKIPSKKMADSPRIPDSYFWRIRILDSYFWRIRIPDSYFWRIRIPDSSNILKAFLN